MTQPSAEPPRLLLPFLFVFFAFTANAQTTTVPDPQSRFGPGTTKTTTVTSDNAFTEITVTEYKDADGYVRQREIEKKFVDGTGESTDSTFSQGGRLEQSWIVKSNREGKATSIESRTYKRGKLQRGSSTTVTYNPDGSFTSVERDLKTGAVHTRTMSAEELKELEDWRQEQLKRRQQESGNNIQGCLPNAEIFGGYSLLNADYGMERETYPLGGNIGFTYYLTGGFGLTLDASIHIKKKYEFTDRQIYFGVGVHYNLQEPNCDRAVTPYLNMLAGFRSEAGFYDGEKTFSETNLSVLAGGGVIYNPPKNFDLSVGINYNPVFGSTLQHNFRASFLVRYDIGR